MQKDSPFMIALQITMDHKKETPNRREYCKAVKVKTWKKCDRCGYFICSGSRVLKWGKDIFTHMICTRK